MEGNVCLLAESDREDLVEVGLGPRTLTWRPPNSCLSRPFTTKSEPSYIRSGRPAGLGAPRGGRSPPSDQVDRQQHGGDGDGAVGIGHHPSQGQDLG